MSPAKIRENNHGKRENNVHGRASFPPPPLKINRDSHFIKKPTSSSPSSSSSSPSTVVGGGSPGKLRQPVIIYTHSPKIIHTHPKDFMALVQKLTGMSRPEDDKSAVAAAAASGNLKNPEKRSDKDKNDSNNDNKAILGNNNNVINHDGESSSVITTEENIGDQRQVNFCGIRPPPPPLMFDSPGNLSYFSTIPVFGTNPSDNFLCTNQPVYNFDAESLLLAPNMRNSFSSSSSSSSSSGFEGLTEFREF